MHLQLESSILGVFAQAFNLMQLISDVLATSLATSLKKRIFAYAKTKAQISCAVTAQFISAFVFATWIVQLLLYLYSKLQVSSFLL